jgi:hypothetical protein
MKVNCSIAATLIVLFLAGCQPAVKQEDCVGTYSYVDAPGKTAAHLTLNESGTYMTSLVLPDKLPPKANGNLMSWGHIRRSF